MNERRSKMLRIVAKEQDIDINIIKRWYKYAPTPRRLQFIAVRGQMITLTNSFIDQLKLGIFPSKSLSRKDK